MMDNIDSWLQKKTYHHRDFDKLDQLLKLKEKKGLSISLCIPTLNEENTIGKEIVILKSELQNRYPLLDEIAVIDSNSSDKTLEVAQSFGADTYLADHILPHLPKKKGKGENLWKAIYQLKGDIIIYIDADIHNIHPRFVYALLGPLLNHDEVEYVKAFYERPFVHSGQIRSSGGGRVTEILIRPLFSLFFPGLTALMQPLSGEYAVRRRVLESIPFPIGYGVETSHLIDVYQRLGLEAFAQVDLDRRVHRNQPVHALGRMSFSILQTFWQRLLSYGLIDSHVSIETLLRQFRVSGEYFELQQIACEQEERPPMSDIVEYQKKRQEATLSELD